MGAQQISCYLSQTKLELEIGADLDMKLIILDPDSANNFGSDRIRIHNTVTYGIISYGRRYLKLLVDFG